jgi:hypothetical protein
VREKNWWYFSLFGDIFDSAGNAPPTPKKQAQKHLLIRSCLGRLNGSIALLRYIPYTI